MGTTQTRTQITDGTTTRPTRAGSLDRFAATLRRALARRTTLTDCAAVTCDLLVRAGCAMPSIYVERSGRLHCYASRGYWQVLSGIPVDAGVVGQVMRSGETAVVDVAACDHFLTAEPGIAAEVCAPILVDGRPVGVVSVESRTALPPGTRELVEAATAQLARRVGELGGAPRATGWRLVADATALLDDRRGLDPVAGQVAAIAAELAGMSSAMVVTGCGAADAVDEHEDRGTPASVAVHGPLGAALASLTSRNLREIATWVEGPRSCFTVDDPRGAGFLGHDVLTACGVRTVVVVSVAGVGDRHGYLLVADEERRATPAEVIEQLEVLGGLVGGAIERDGRLRALVELGRRDALTGLPNAGALRERLRDRARGGRTAVLVADVDHFKQVNDEHGHQAGDDALRAVSAAMAHALRASDELFRNGGDEFTAVLDVDDAEEALTIAERVRVAAQAAGHPVSIGVAVLAGTDGDPDDAVALADRALYTVKRRGRNGVHLARE